MADTSAVVATILSILCSIILFLVWTVDSKWRSLHNFINIHQIIIGTLHLCIIHMDWGISNNSEYSSFLLPASMCWTLCASLLAYTRLVLLVTGKISYGKRKAAAFSYGTLIILLIVVKLVIPTMFELQGDVYLEPTVAGAYFLMFLNMLVVFKVMSSVVPCCKKKISRTGGTRALSLVGIAILCDMVTSISLVLPVLLVFDFLFNFRLVLHTLVVLLNKSSVEHFKKQWQKRKRVNEILDIQID